MVLFGHHFSSIAGAGPIVGPIIATLAFGWLPVILWVLIGSIFFGGVHDFSIVVASIRHKGNSIANVAKEYLSNRAKMLFLIFVWLALIYIIVVFVDLTADTFVIDGGVATTSIIYIFLAIAFGIVLYRVKIRLFYATLIFVPLVFVSIWVGQVLPLDFKSIPIFGEDTRRFWSVLLIIYCFFASVLPVWFLLQPRDYLSSYLLYFSVIAAGIGIIIGGFNIEFPAFLKFHSENLGYLFPVLFITVACGAISGFHSLVASGTTSKQLNVEQDACFVGYGGMLTEGVVAVISLITVVIISGDNSLLKGQPLQIYSAGMGKFFLKFGISEGFGSSFGILAISAFILTTLDTATRLGRYVVQELCGGIDKFNRFPATVITLFLPLIFIFIKFTDSSGNIVPAWKAIWPVFGATNQLLAALALLVIYIWLKTENRKAFFISIPMVFMLVITLTALFSLILKFRLSIIGLIALFLFILAVILCFETIFAYKRIKSR